jgi:hypothetical protein
VSGSAKNAPSLNPKCATRISEGDAAGCHFPVTKVCDCSARHKVETSNSRKGETGMNENIGNTTEGRENIVVETQPQSEEQSLLTIEEEGKMIISVKAPHGLETPEKIRVATDPRDKEQCSLTTVEAEYFRELLAMDENHYLDSLRNRSMTISCFDSGYEVDAKKIPEFVPIRCELLQLLENWETNALDIEYSYFLRP